MLLRSNLLCQSLKIFPSYACYYLYDIIIGNIHVVNVCYMLHLYSCSKYGTDYICDQ